MPSRDRTPWRTWKPGTAIAIGLSLGVLVGTVLDNISLWLALGVVFEILGEDALSKNRPSQ